jgi:RNA polymerase sporulation-specific sigma factor
MLHFLFAAMNEALNGIFFLFGYVSNTNSFPQPLTVEEEIKYIEAYKNGNEDARNTLIERNLRLVAHIVKKYNTYNGDCDDLISIGTIGLIKAISTFDQSKGTRLATYAARCIENAIPSLRKHSCGGYSVSWLNKRDT